MSWWEGGRVTRGARAWREHMVAMDSRTRDLDFGWSGGRWAGSPRGQEGGHMKRMADGSQRVSQSTGGPAAARCSGFPALYRA